MRSSLQKAVHADKEFLTLTSAGRELGLTRYRILVLCSLAGVARAAAGQAAALERIRQQHAHDEQYAQEDLVVRNLRATGFGDQADRQAFVNQQAREYTKSYEQAMADGLLSVAEELYLNTLKTTQNNELIAFNNGLLQQFALNMVSGYKLQATVFGAMMPGGGGTVPHSGTSSGGQGGGGGYGGGQTLEVVLSGGTIDIKGLDGASIGKAVLKDFKGKAQKKFGDSSRWPEIQS